MQLQQGRRRLGLGGHQPGRVPLGERDEPARGEDEGGEARGRPLHGLQGGVQLRGRDLAEKQQRQVNLVGPDEPVRRKLQRVQ